MDQPNASVIEVVLTAIRLVARDTHVFTFERPDHGIMPPAEAGAHIGILLPNGMERQYSLTDPDPSPRQYSIGVKLDAASRGGSRYLHEQARVGMRFDIHPPRNNFPLDESVEETILVAGGIGITPIYAMVQRLKALGKSWRLHHACRSREDAAFLREFEGLPNVVHHFDDEQGGPLAIADLVAAAPAGAHLYCCGPTPMLAAFETAVVASGRPAAHGHVEYFTQKFETALEGGFVVELARSGFEIEIAAGTSILHAVQAAGISVPSSCEEGICGSCETRVISGTPDHRDAILTEAERERSETMMICCSGSKADRLVLDL